MFDLSSVSAAFPDTTTNKDVVLKLSAISKKEEVAEIIMGRVPRLVRYKGNNRYGARDGGLGGDDWVLPSVRGYVESFSGVDWGDFSNMNGGFFSPHAGHNWGADVDGWFAGYNARDA